MQNFQFFINSSSYFLSQTQFFFKNQPLTKRTFLGVIIAHCYGYLEGSIAGLDKPFNPGLATINHIMMSFSVREIFHHEKIN